MDIFSLIALSKAKNAESKSIGVYHYKGSVATESALPSQDNVQGDVWNIVDTSTYGPAGTNVAWDGAAWDALGGMAPVTSVNGQTGAVVLDAADVGAAEAFLVTVTRDVDMGYTADKTIDEIFAAYLAGEELWATFPIPMLYDGFTIDFSVTAPLSPLSAGPDSALGYVAVVLARSFGGTAVNLYQLSIFSNGVGVVQTTLTSGATPQALGTASAGTSLELSRADHVHPMPSAADVGALPSNTTYVSSVNGSSGAVTVSVPSDYVAYSSQSLTDAQKTQARTNIGAGTYSKPTDGIPASDLAIGVIPEKLVVTYTLSGITSGSSVTCDKTFLDIFLALQAKIPIEAYAVYGAVAGQFTSITFDGTNIGFSSTYATGLSTFPNNITSMSVWHNSTGIMPLMVNSISAGTDITPAANGIASPGYQNDFYALADHVHPMPSASDVGAIAAPSSPNTGDTLVYNGSAWVAQNPTPETTVSTAGAVTQALDAGKIYHFTGSLTSLTLTLNAAASGQLAQYHFDFTTGSSAPTVTLPSSVIMPDDWNADANKHYEVDILNNYAVIVDWAVSA